MENGDSSVTEGLKIKTFTKLYWHINKYKFKNKFCRCNDIKGLYDLCFSQNQPL